MEEIEVGEYVRSKDGIIIKADFIDFERLTLSQKGLGWDFENVKEMREFIENEIVKHSLNIIDLIEVGDYVNGNEVVTVYGYDEDGNDRDDRGIIEVDDDYAYGVYLEDIKIFSIVTKEQFASMEYKVGE